MIELTYYEKKTISIRPSQLLTLDERIRKELGISNEEPMLIHDLLIHGRKHGLGIRLPDPQNIEPDDECGPPTVSHLGYTRKELIEWMTRCLGDENEDIPDLFDDLDNDRKECKVCQTLLEDGECPNRKCGNSPLFDQQ